MLNKFLIKKSMKKFVLFGMIMLMAGNVFCQTPMDKSQKKQVSEIHKKVTKEHDAILKNPTLTADEKKARIDATKTARDAQLAVVLSTDQKNALLAKDPIKWTKMYSAIEKQEKSKMKAERDQKLKEVDKQIRELDSQQAEIKRQTQELKRKQKDLDVLYKAARAKKKEINAQYK